MVETQDLHIKGFVPLMAPRTLKREFPLSAAAKETVVVGRQAVTRILNREDDRLLVIVGPCSIHDPKAAMDYAQRLKALRSKLADRLEIVMRVYFEKPRTTVGWKGLINDPDMDGTCDIEKGLRMGRRLLLDVAELGLPAATEVLDPIVPQYLDDLLSWAAIGARTTESQTHRELASGLSMPVGFKNSTDGSLQVAIDAMHSSRAEHSFLGIDPEGITAIVRTTGNPNGHVVLRGGHGKPNYDADSIRLAEAKLVKSGLPPVLMVDCSHANSGKQHAKQEDVLHSLVEQRRKGATSIIGAMVESNLEEGSQPIPKDLSMLRYGVSITDACINWDTTERILVWAAENAK
ncbi:MAG TPA: 3-deoxy-7-phosphoheptulonate synthase [Holophaga sp.]|jgi:3-deoxy-7-phosphoheptulonate synthase|nr:3-deoxy-7-phosphoheptulonate synthase [Holophaga sp.]